MKDLDISATKFSNDEFDEQLAKVTPDMKDISIRHFKNKTMVLPKIAGTYKLENINDSNVTVSSRASIVTCHGCTINVHEYIPLTYLCNNTKLVLHSNVDENRFGDPTITVTLDDSNQIKKPGA